MGSHSGSQRRLHQPLCLGRDYHKTLRKRMKTLASHLLEPHQFRVFSDSAPVLEKHFAEQAGLGWIGKHTPILSKDQAAGAFWLLFDRCRLASHPGPGNAPLRQLHRLYRYLPDQSDRCALSIGCAALHWLSHHRDGRADSD